MSKDAEQAYLSHIGEDGRAHTLRKPFSDPLCGMYLASIGTLMSLMPPPPARILDLGCGGGWTSVLFARAGYDVTGQDIAADMIELARECKAINGVGDNLRFVQSDYETLDVEDAFDCAVFFDCLHHAEDEGAAIASAYRALKPGGLLLTHEPGKGHARTAESVEAMRRYGVNERDMPPRLIIRRGLEVGFRQAKVYPLPRELQATVYDPARPSLTRLTGLRRLVRTLRMIVSPSHDASSIVVMVK